MRLATLVFIFLSILMFSSCRKKGMRKITQSDDYGNWMAEIDETDWTYDEKLPNKIEKIFREMKVENPPTEPFEGELGVHQYPNPLRGTVLNNQGMKNKVFQCQFTVSFKGKNTICKLVIVDRYNKVFGAVSKVSLSDRVNFNLIFSGKDKHFYRLYYLIEDKNGFELYKGHGDIQIDNEFYKR